jgi:ATP synthase alpha/beta family, beta-barrel domain
LAQRLNGPAVREAFLEWLLNEIRKLPEPARRAMTADNVALEAASATPLERAEQERYRARIGEALGSRPQIAFSADPALIAGLELRGPHLVVSNSWRADLTQSSRTSPVTGDPDFQADAWLDQARARLGAAALGPRAEQIGRVEEVADGVALVSGMPDIRLDELLRFGRGQFGFAQALEWDRISCVLLDDVDAVEVGDLVRGAGDVVRVPVGPALLGRVVDPLGRPLDGKGPIAVKATRPIERPAPAIIDRDLVMQPVQTDLTVVDTLFALGGAASAS